jgi:hypothetical protein
MLDAVNMLWAHCCTQTSKQTASNQFPQEKLHFDHHSAYSRKRGSAGLGLSDAENFAFSDGINKHFLIYGVHIKHQDGAAAPFPILRVN